MRPATSGIVQAFVSGNRRGKEAASVGERHFPSGYAALRLHNILFVKVIADDARPPKPHIIPIVDILMKMRIGHFVPFLVLISVFLRI